MTVLQQIYLKAKENRQEETMWSLVVYMAIYSFKCAICLQTPAAWSFSGTRTEDLAIGKQPACLKEMDPEEKSLDIAREILVVQSLWVKHPQTGTKYTKNS